MSASAVEPPGTSAAGQPDAGRRRARLRRTPVGAALQLVLAMAVLGLVAGVLWAAWSPVQPPGLVVQGGTATVESEQQIAADGRFAVLAVVLGVFFAVLAWRARGARGPLPLAGLAVGGILGALVTDLVGFLVAGGSSGGPLGVRHAQLRLVVHMPGLLFLESLVAVLLYGVLVAFAAADDLGRSDPWHRGAAAADSVDGGGDLNGGEGQRDTAGAAQQPPFPPQ